MRAGHPLRAKRLTLDVFLAMEHAVVRAEGRSQEIFERFLERKKIRRRIALLTPHFLSLPMIIARSDLVATVPHAIGLYFSRLSPALAIARPPLGAFRESVDAFRAAGGCGINISTPFKLDAYTYATDRMDRARFAGASNCLKFEGDRVYAENFDGIGLVIDVERNLGWPLRGR